jgi:AcrR family transcriptional regulator
MNGSNQNLELEILNAAERLFLRKGFSLTSTTEIAKEAGCNQALVHYYYRTKEKLFTRIYEKNALLFLKDLLDGNRQSLTFEEKIREIIEGHFNMLIKNPQLPLFLFNELIMNEKRLEILRENLDENHPEVYRKFENELNREIEKGNIRQTTLLDLILTTFSLNVMLFIISPILKKAFINDETRYREFVDHRREENVRIILLSLKP